MSLAWSHLRALLPVASTLVIGVALSIAIAAYVERQVDQDARGAFDRDASAATAEIEREIERHIHALDELVAFSNATWPGDIAEWRRFVDGRVIGGANLAFTSTAGLIERVPANQIAAFEAREARTSGEDFTLIELTPLAPEADRMVLTRTLTDASAGIEIRGLDVSAALELLGGRLPEPDDGLTVTSVDQAPEPVLDLFAMDIDLLADDEIITSNVVFIHALGVEGEEPLGWVVVLAELSKFLSSAVDDLDHPELNIAISIPDTNVDLGMVGYEGDTRVGLVDAALTRSNTIKLGAWEWELNVWAREDFGITAERIRGLHVLAGGLVATLGISLLLAARRRHAQTLSNARMEAELQRMLAETDPLTSLLNRKGLSSIGRSEGVIKQIECDGGATFFLDLDGFKLINDGKGHAAGDAVLVAVSRSISGVSRVGDAVGRLGGDEFAVLCPGLSDEVAAKSIADRMGQAIRSISDPAPVDVSIGVSLTRPGSAFNFEHSLQVADAAMYKAKGDSSQAAKLEIATWSPETVSS